MMRLRELAHSRTGDKGTLVTISLIAYRQQDYPRLLDWATVERVSELFRHQIVRPVTRYEVPGLWALNFVLQRPATESVTRSLAIDAHGKTLGSILLDMEIL
jgi:hypothetical protein